MALELLPEGATKDMLTCSDPTIPSDDSNLVIKVRRAMRTHASTRRHYES